MKVVAVALAVSVASSRSVSCIAEAQQQQRPRQNCDNEPLTELEKLDRWSRGAFSLVDDGGGNCSEDYIGRTQQQYDFIRLKASPVRPIRRRVWRDCAAGDCSATATGTWGSDDSDLLYKWALSPRGGGASTRPSATSAAAQYEEKLERKIQALISKFGPEFEAAIEQNRREHDEDCRKSCELYYCAPKENTTSSSSSSEVGYNETVTTFRSYSMGATPPEDFAEQFGFPLDLIKVSEGEPFFDGEEASQVIRGAEAEGVANNEFQSGKYKLGGDWLTNLPKTRDWFNRKLKSNFFPAFAMLFPEIVSSPAVLRAHSVSLLKYNTSHPRTDVHIDNGILALTVAMTPKTQYQGGGTFFEHMGVDNVVEMDVGHATLRPGGTRHGGHRVTSGTRYILGCFLLIENKVEHVRRLKNRGSMLRQQKGDIAGAAKHFEWALALNPKCTTW